MSGNAITSVQYKNTSWMRYILWFLAAVCIVVLFSVFFNTMNGEISATVPEGYRFSVTDNYNEGSKVRTTYYVYEDKVFVEDESMDDDKVNRTVMIYEDINTATIQYNPDDKMTICELGSCLEKPKVLAVIKNLISRKVGREYLGL